MAEVAITGKTLTIEEVKAVAHDRVRVRPLSKETKSRMTAT